MYRSHYSWQACVGVSDSHLVVASRAFLHLLGACRHVRDTALVEIRNRSAIHADARLPNLAVISTSALSFDSTILACS